MVTSTYTPSVYWMILSVNIGMCTHFLLHTVNPNEDDRGLYMKK